MNKPARHPDAESTQDAILDAAESLFMERGFAGTSMSSIAKAAGVTKSLIHHHFDTKQRLWHAVKQRMFQEYGQQQLEMLQTSDGDEELLRHSIDFYFHYFDSHPEMSRLLLYSCIEAQQNPELAEHEPDDGGVGPDALFELGIQRIREAQERGQVRRELDPAYVLMSFLGLVEHWFQAREFYLGKIGREDLAAEGERYLENMKAIFFDGIRPRE